MSLPGAPVPETAARDVTVTGTNRVPGTVNYLRGKTRPGRKRAPPLRPDRLPRPWPNIDLLLHERRRPEDEFHVRPGGRASDIRLAYAGAEAGSRCRRGAADRDGVGVLRDAAPVSYQDDHRPTGAGESRYLLEAEASKAPRFAFGVGTYERDHELVIDPGVQFTTFLGGNSAETGQASPSTAAGNSYIAGTTQSPNFPTTTGAFRRTGATTTSLTPSSRS